MCRREPARRKLRRQRLRRPSAGSRSIAMHAQLGMLDGIDAGQTPQPGRARMQRLGRARRPSPSLRAARDQPQAGAARRARASACTRCSAEPTPQLVARRPAPRRTRRRPRRDVEAPQVHDAAQRARAAPWRFVETQRKCSGRAGSMIQRSGRRAAEAVAGEHLHAACPPAAASRRASASPMPGAVGEKQPGAVGASGCSRASAPAARVPGHFVQPSIGRAGTRRDAGRIGGGEAHALR